METKICPKKNVCSASSLVNFKNIHILKKELKIESKENIQKISNSNVCKKNEIKDINLSLIKFMVNHNKMHLSTKYGHKESEKFLKEKDKAMEKIELNEEIEKNNIENKCSLSENKNNKNLSHLVIFHGTFGKEALKEHHHHHQHHHRHHHHHHHNHSEDKIKNDNRNDNNGDDKAIINKNDISFKC